ncbi:hypothetical protein GZL_09280 [Streptomyces sp. 769]|nr:hypothetical protein GZL_09280 [Streptomyces sp. 769]
MLGLPGRSWPRGRPHSPIRHAVAPAFPSSARTGGKNPFFDHSRRWQGPEHWGYPPYPPVTCRKSRWRLSTGSGYGSSTGMRFFLERPGAAPPAPRATEDPQPHHPANPRVTRLSPSPSRIGRSAALWTAAPTISALPPVKLPAVRRRPPKTPLAVPATPTEPYRGPRQLRKPSPRT